jgi:hypothetical protein
MILIPQGKVSSLRAMRPSLRAGSWGGAWAGGKRVEIAFLWGYPVDSTASLCNNGVKKTELDSTSVRMTDRIVEF